MKMSNDGQYAKAKRDYGKDFYSEKGSSADSGLKKGATTMEKESVKAGRFATGGALRQPRDGSMKFARGGFPTKALHSMKEDAADIAADKIDAKKRGMKPSAFEGTPADERMDKMGAKPKGFPRNKAAKFATGGAAKPVKRNMGGMMSSGMQPPTPAPAPQVGGIGAPAPVPGMAPQFRKGGKVAPVKLAMGGVGKQRHNAMSKSGMPMSPRKAGKSEQVI